MTEHFSYAELTKTETGIPNDAPLELAGNLTRLAEMLEQVRSLLGDFPIKINSAYRSPEVNKAVGGVSTSQHTRGLAADFNPGNVSKHVAFDLIRASEIQFDQLIVEPTWIHISVPEEGKAPRRQCLVASVNGGRMRYEVPRG